MRNWTSSREAILAVPVPDNTRTYGAIPHSVFLEEIQQELTTSGYEIIEERYLTSDACKVITGVFKIKSDDLELAPSVSFVNSYNRKRIAEIRAGAMVLVCKNGMMGTVDNGSYSRKHTTNALGDFREHIKVVIDGLDKEFQRLQYNKEEMKAITLDRKIIATLVGDMLVNEKLITTTQLGILQKQLKKSECFKGNTLWDFYNHCTEAFKDTHPMYFDKQHVKFHTYICDKFKLMGSRGLFEALPEYAGHTPVSFDAETLSESLEPEVPISRIRLEDDYDLVEALTEGNEEGFDSEIYGNHQYDEIDTLDDSEG